MISLSGIIQRRARRNKNSKLIISHSKGQLDKHRRSRSRKHGACVKCATNPHGSTTIQHAQQLLPGSFLNKPSSKRAVACDADRNLVLSSSAQQQLLLWRSNSNCDGPAEIAGSLGLPVGRSEQPVRQPTRSKSRGSFYSR